MQLDAIKGYLPLTPDILTAGQPTQAQLSLLKAAGFHHVINLGLMDPRYCLADEAGSVRSLGLAYTHIPVDFNAPDAGSLHRLFAGLDAAGGQRVFVHCAANYRVTCFMALYAQSRWHWTQARADAVIGIIWTPNPTWSAFLAQQRQALGLGLPQQHELTAAAQARP